MKKLFCFLIGVLLVFNSCKTIDLERHELELNGKSVDGAKTQKEVEAQLRQDEQAAREALIEQQVDSVDIKETVVYVEKPIYVPADKKGHERPTAKAGLDTVNLSLNTALQEPVKYRGSHHIYDFDDTFIYQIYCAPYRITDLQLEVGEEILEQPFCSEPEVWEIGGGVSKFNGVDVQHLFLKPSYAKLTTSLIIITNRRVYHLLLKSYAESWMGVVKFNYPLRLQYNGRASIGGISPSSESTKIETVMEGVSPEHLSFDYKMSFLNRRKNKITWLPKRVYDDGRKTYIVLDDDVMNKKLPGLFDQKNNIINYRVAQNILIIDHLIEKVTLKLGKDKVTVEKKKAK